MIGRALTVWLVIAVAEVLHGILRVALLNRRVGDRRARQIGVFSGSALILVIAWLTAPWVRMATVADALTIGLC